MGDEGYVLDEFRNEMHRSNLKHPGCESLPNGTGQAGRKTWEALAKNGCDRAHREGRLTWTDVFDEECAEVMAAENDEDIRAELVQVGAMCLKWIMDIDRRGT